MTAPPFATGRQKLPSTFWRWWFWKEWRLVKPLVLALVAVAPILSLMAICQGMFYPAQHIPPIATMYFTLAVPWLLAFALPLVLIAQELETGTMGWLQASSLSRKQLMLGKSMSCIAVLLTALMTSMIANAVYSSIEGDVLLRLVDKRWPVAGNFLPGDYPVWTLITALLFLISTAASYRCKTVFGATQLSLLAVALIFCLLVLLEGNGRHIGRYNTGSKHYTVLFVFLSVGCLIAGSASLFEGIRRLSPSTPSGLGQKTLLSDQSSRQWEISFSDQHFRPPMLREVTSGLLYLFFVGRWRRWVAFTGMIAFGLLCHALDIYDDRRFNGNSGIYMAAATLGCFLGTVFVGATIWQGDSSASSIRFLAERGISPSRIFFASHAIGLGLLFLLISCWFPISALIFKRGEPLISPLMLLLVGLVVYSTASYASQVLKTPLLAYLLAPIAALFALWWWSICTTVIGGSWLVTTTIHVGVIFFASWLGMRRYLSRQSRGTDFAIVIGVTIAIVCLPLLVPIIEFTQQPSVSPKALAELRMLAGESGYRRSAIEATYFLDHLEYDQELKPGWNRFPSAAHLDKEDSTKLAIASENFYYRWLEELQFQTSIWELSATSDAEGSLPEMTPEYVEEAWAETLLRTTKWIARLRPAADFLEQERLDQIEFWLASALFEPRTKEMLSVDQKREIASMLLTRDRRFKFRRAGLGLEFSNLDNARRHRSRSYWLLFSKPSGIETILAPNRPTEKVFAALLEGCSESANQGWRDKLRTLLPDRLWLTTDQLQSGNRLNGITSAVTLTPIVDYLAPGQLWNLDWEKDLENWKEEFDEG
ncbi:MAG: hypothetical protein AAF664_23035 [Planctomycetota bacterium]